jgi:hypothetical protein
VQDALIQGPVEGYPGLYVSSHCVETIREWKYLRFREGMKNEYATGAFQGADHAFDAARYFIQTRPLPQVEKMDDEGEWLKKKKKRMTHRLPRWAARLDRAERRAFQ